MLASLGREGTRGWVEDRGATQVCEWERVGWFCSVFFVTDPWVGGDGGSGQGFPFPMPQNSTGLCIPPALGLGCWRAGCRAAPWWTRWGWTWLGAHLHLSQCVGVEVAVAGLLLGSSVLPITMALPYPGVS